MIDKLQSKLIEVISDLIANNASAVAKELRENPEGKLSVAVSAKLQLIGQRVYVSGTLGYSRKFTDESEGMFEIEDPQQPDLIGSEDKEATIRIVTASGSDTGNVPMSEMKEALQTLKAAGRKAKA